MKPTLYEKLATRLQNHRLVAVLILIGTIVIGFSAFTDAAKNLTGLFSKPNPEEARLKLAGLGVPYTPEDFIEQAAEGDLTLVKLFLAAGMDPNVILGGEGGPTALFFAVRENRSDVVEALLKAGAKVLNQGSNALVAAAETGNVAMLNRLLESPVPKEKLDDAFAVGLNRPVLEVLLTRGADVRARGAEALLYTRDPEALSFLVSHGADINFRDATGKTWLERSSFNSINLDTLQVLIERGADLNSRGRNGWTLLTMYASKGYLNGIQMLVARKVTVDMPNPEGRTALSLACDLSYPGSRDIVQLLLKSGADVNTRDSAGKRPIDYAGQRPNNVLVEFLIAQGAAE